MEDNRSGGFWTYRILGIFNNFIAVLFLFGVMVNFGIAGFQPSLLLPLFIAFSILLYTNLSVVFARQVLQARKYLRTRLKDWIRVNAYVTLIYSVFQFLLLLVVLTGSNVLETMGERLGMSVGTVRGVALFCMASSVLLGVHVVLSFRYLRRYGAYFQDPPAEQ
ncbi:hypothetical protein [Compostibacter hankyongensis]|uniref:Uncharacterized protein n=1 Tax=Compostibacter hankyongensis TaxID=1007089 RepID=A0ABP8FID9_9BACT